MIISIIDVLNLLIFDYEIVKSSISSSGLGTWENIEEIKKKMSRNFVKSYKGSNNETNLR